MIKVALAGLLGRKLRTALTAIAIVLGVAMISGTFVLTDSIDKAFSSIFTDVRKGSSVVVSGKSAFDLSQGQGSFAPTLNESLLNTVRNVPGVAAVEGSVNGEALLVDQKGKAIVFGGAPNLGFSIANPQSPFNVLRLEAGSWPHGNEVVIGKSTADRKHFHVGDTIGVQAEGPVQKLKIAGLVTFGSAASLGGATLAGFDLPTAQRLFD
jgi:ABC-type lipoprotein release transport system permease subunit